MDPIDIQPLSTLLGALITGAASIIVAFINNRIPRGERQPDEDGIVLPPGVVLTRPANISMKRIILFIIIGGLIGFFLGSAIRSLVFPAEVEILAPLDNSQIPCVVDTCQIMVDGIVNGLLESEAIWILVYPKVEYSFYYPQHEPAAVDVKGQWTSPAIIGIYEPEDDGKVFDIVVVIADKDAQSILATGEKLTRMPMGVNIYQRISVIRE